MRKPNDQMQAVLDAHREMGPLPIETLDAVTARQIPLADRAAMAVYGQHISKRAFATNPLPVGKVEHILIDGADDKMLCRVYTPTGKPPEGGWPTVVYFHGGGFVIATLDTYDASCRSICDGAEAVVVSVHYRQAPENQWPAAPEDAFAAYQWVLQHAQMFNGNPLKVAVAGESAGGNLAAVVTLMAKHHNIQAPLHQVLIYPVVDMLNGPKSESAKTYATAKPLNTAMLNWFYDYYVPANADRRDEMISPTFATDLTGLPTATIILAEIDPLCSEGETYATKLMAAGVMVHVKKFEGVTHEFFGMVGIVDEAAEAVAMVCKNLKTYFKYKAKKSLAA